MKPEVGGIHFWVSGDSFPNFNHLYCDLVFVVQEKVYWADAYYIAPTDPIVDSTQAYKDHYRWHYQHPFKRRRRFTLKADPDLSFQPQDENGCLIDILPFLLDQGIPLDAFRNGMKAGCNSKPYSVDRAITGSLYEWLNNTAYQRLRGQDFQNLL